MEELDHRIALSKSRHAYLLSAVEILDGAIAEGEKW